MAAEAAAEQGKFWEMHDKLFENQNHLEDETLLMCAEEIGLDPEFFNTEMVSEEHRNRVLTDRRSGVHSGVRGTRNLFINGRRYRKAMELETILMEIEQLQMQERKHELR